MELLDVIYSELRNEFDGVKVGGKETRVAYAYEFKEADVEAYNWIIVSAESEGGAVFTVGGDSRFSDQTITITVRTTIGEFYTYAKDKIEKMFMGRTYVLERRYISNEVGMAKITKSEDRSLHVRVYELEEPLNVDRFVWLELYDIDTFDKVDEGVVLLVDGNRIWLFRRECIIILVTAVSGEELSSSIRGTYYFTIGVFGRVIKVVR